MKASEREFLGDIITTAVEGGTNYWAQVSQYQYVHDGNVHVYTGMRVGDETRAVLHQLNEDESDYLTEGMVLTLDAVKKGIDRIVSGEVGVSDRIVDAVKRAASELDAGEIDSSDADVIAQVALLGDVVYG